MVLEFKFVKICKLFLFSLVFMFLFFSLTSCSSSNLSSDDKSSYSLSNVDFNSMSDSELFEFVFDNLDDFEGGKNMRNNSEIAKLLIATRDSCKVFEQINQTLAKTTVKNNQLFLGDTPLSHERLISLIELFYVQNDFVSEGNTVLIMGNNKSSDYVRSGKGVLLSNDFVLIDTVVRHKNGFWADNARTWLIGNLSSEKIDQFNAVFDSLKFAQTLFLSGVKTQTIPPVIFDFFENLGFKSSDDFGMRHNPGHGVSAKGHDYPAISVFQDDVLRERMVLTTELGLYYGSTGGVRLENTGVITKKGFVPFCNFPLRTQFVK